MTLPSNASAALDLVLAAHADDRGRRCIETLAAMLADGSATASIRHRAALTLEAWEASGMADAIEAFVAADTAADRGFRLFQLDGFRAAFDSSPVVALRNAANGHDVRRDAVDFLARLTTEGERAVRVLAHAGINVLDVEDGDA